MSFLDISTYIMLHSGPLTLLFTTTILFSIIMAPVTAEANRYSEDKNRVTYIESFRRYSPILMIFLVAVLIGFLPTHSKMLQVKIERIKNEAVTRENIGKGLESLEKVICKLETKYLGGECSLKGGKHE